MKVINSHRRNINQSQDKVSTLFETLSSKTDQIWPYENWPAIKFDNGLKVGSKGGHGRIGYTIVEYNPNTFIKFQFTEPNGFYGTHTFSVKEITDHTTEVIHTIEMTTSGFATIYWILAIRWLHDALIEDAFDKLESHFSTDKKETNHTVWVRILRYILKPKQKTNN